MFLFDIIISENMQLDCKKYGDDKMIKRVIVNDINHFFEDFESLSDDEIKKMFEGCEGFVFAAGVDERVEGPAPIYDLYKKYNIYYVFVNVKLQCYCFVRVMFLCYIDFLGGWGILWFLFLWI